MDWIWGGTGTVRDARRCLAITRSARLAQSAERKALNLVVVGSSPTVGVCCLASVSMPRKAARVTHTSGVRGELWGEGRGACLVRRKQELPREGLLRELNPVPLAP